MTNIVKYSTVILLIFLAMLGCTSHSKLWCTNYLLRITSINSNSFFVQIEKSECKHSYADGSIKDSLSCDNIEAYLAINKDKRKLLKTDCKEQFFNIQGFTFSVSDTNILRIDSIAFRDKLNAKEFYYSIKDTGEVVFEAQSDHVDSELKFRRKITVNRDGLIPRI